VQIIGKIETATSASDFLTCAKIFAGTHHEKWDGKGTQFDPALTGAFVRVMGLAGLPDI
jgi:HD-GYP domain-containing protein (c-di-GMP phosphodiesterase class II)